MKEIRICWDDEGASLHVEGGVTLQEGLGYLEWAKFDLIERGVDDL